MLRLALTFSDRPLWIDEAMLALNVGRHGVPALAGPLDYEQVAPIFYLWLLKGLVAVFGMHEWVLRLPTLLAGLLLPLVTWRVGLRIGGRVMAIVATALVACSPALIEYADEVKPYGVGALLGVALIGLALRELDRPHHPHRLGLAFAGLIATSFSFGAVFVLAAVGIALSWRSWRRRDAAALVGLALIGVIWIAAFAVPYFTVHRVVAEDAMMRSYWSEATIAVGREGWRWRTVSGLRQLLHLLPVFRPLPMLGVLLAVLGATVVAAPRRIGLARTVLLALPPVIAVGLAALGRYPLATRLLLDLLPLIALLFGLGATMLWDRIGARRWARPAAAALVIGLAMGSFRTYMPSRPQEEGRDGIRRMLAVRRGEPVYLLASSVPAWVFYSTDWAAPDTARLTWYAKMGSGNGPVYHNRPSRGGPVRADEPVPAWGGSAGLELIARASGIRYEEGREYLTESPDMGWADGEARRLKHAAPNGAWVVLTHPLSYEVGPWFAALTRAGGRSTAAVVERRAAVHFVTFTRSIP